MFGLSKLKHLNAHLFIQLERIRIAPSTACITRLSIGDFHLLYKFLRYKNPNKLFSEMCNESKNPRCKMAVDKREYNSACSCKFSTAIPHVIELN